MSAHSKKVGFLDSVMLSSQTLWAWKCSGLNPKTKVMEKKPKSILVHGKKVEGWMVKIVQEQAEGHLGIDFRDYSDE